MQDYSLKTTVVRAKPVVPSSISVNSWATEDNSRTNRPSVFLRSTVGGVGFSNTLDGKTFDPSEDAVTTRAVVSALAAKRRALCQKAQVKFVEIAKAEHLEYGYTAPSERFMHDFANEHMEHPGIVGELAQSIQLVAASDSMVMLALLNAIGSFEYDFVRPYGQILALAALALEDLSVKEAAIRVYETWGHPEGVKVLSGMDCSSLPWLDDYRKQVIEDLGGAA